MGASRWSLKPLFRSFLPLYLAPPVERTARVEKDQPYEAKKTSQISPGFLQFFADWSLLFFSDLHLSVPSVVPHLLFRISTARSQSFPPLFDYFSNFRFFFALFPLDVWLFASDLPERSPLDAIIGLKGPFFWGGI